MNSPESKRKQRNPQKVVSPSRDEVNPRSDEVERELELPASENDEDKGAEKDDEDWRKYFAKIHAKDSK